MKGRNKSHIHISHQDRNRILQSLVSSDADALRRLSRVEELCNLSDCGRGITKRIDENRELLQCLQEHAPEVLERCCWIEGWISGTDIFLNNLMARLELSTPAWMVKLHCPRPWPGKHSIEQFYECSTPANCASSVILDRVLQVCRESGYRRMGIHKRIDENKNFICSLYKEHVALDQHFLAFMNLAESFKIFFDGIVDALESTFPDVGKESATPICVKDVALTECLNRVLQLCGTGGEKIVSLQNANRNIVYLLKNNTNISSKLFFTESWLEDHELFLEDLHHALEGAFERVHQTGDLVSPSLPWPGDDFTGCQIRFNTSKSAKIFDAFMRTCHWKRSHPMDE